MRYPRFGRKSKRINEEKLTSDELPLGLPSVVERSQAAQPYFASINPSSSSCLSCVRITCDDWDKGGIFDWYRAQPRANICRIELLKERETNFKHEFILVYMDTGRIYRIERRPIGGVNPDAIRSKGAEAEDAITVVGYDDLKLIYNETDTEIILRFNETKADLYAVIAICVAIHLDSETTRYTLVHYNCYFFARTIIALASRYYLLQACSAGKGLRWDCITKSAISCHIFGEDWNKLRTAIRMAMAARIEKLLLDTFKKAAGTLSAKGWDQLKTIVGKVVYGKVVMRQEIDVDEEVQQAVNEWILDATEATLWYGNLEQHLSESRDAKSYRSTAEDVLTGVIRSVLDLPDKTMERSCGIVLECCTQKRPVGINMPPELLARIPVGALEKLPDDLLARLPCDTLQAASTSFLERLPIDVFSRMSDPTIVTLPNDLSCVPSGLLDVALERMQRLLDQPDNPDRVCALRLLHQLPKTRLEQLPQRYIAMRNNEPADEVSLPTKAQVGVDDDQSNRDSTQVKFRPLSKIRKLYKISFIGFLIRVLPTPVLRRVLPFIIDFIPRSSLKSIPKSMLARIPPEHLAELSTCVLDKLPEEFLSRLPESLLMRPQSLQERLSEVLVQRIPRALLNDLPDDLTSLLRQAIRSNQCEGDELREELRSRIWVILQQTLLASCGEIPTNILRVSVRDPSSKNKKSLRTTTVRKHEDMQKYVLDMTRGHSQTLAHLGIGGDKLFYELCDKTEDMWQTNCVPPFGPLLYLMLSEEFRRILLYMGFETYDPVINWQVASVLTLGAGRRLQENANKAALFWLRRLLPSSETYEELIEGRHALATHGTLNILDSDAIKDVGYRWFLQGVQNVRYPQLHVLNQFARGLFLGR